MKFLLLAVLLLNVSPMASCQAAHPSPDTFFAADDKRIQYVGRIDFSDARKPRFWSPGVYVTLRFEGPTCEVSINDEMLYGKNHNYLEIVLDGQPRRRQLTDKANSLRLAAGPGKGAHTLVICKNTESNIGYLEFGGIRCRKLLPPPTLPTRRIEFIGNSITCGTGSDESVVPCGKGVWHDQHNAYLAYGPTVARTLRAQWALTAVSGIGLMHSCCDMDVVMPQVFDKVSLRENKIAWDFARYQPDVVTVCLGQNDGIQDSTTFCRNYLQFLKTLRGHYPQAEIVCLTSPMGDASLTATLRNYLTSIVTAIEAAGDKKVHRYAFARGYTSGCDSHPSLAEHQLIAQELSTYIQTITHW